MLKIIYPARNIPNDAIVSEVHGSVKLTLKREITIFGMDKQVIEATEGVVFLCDKPGVINAISGTSELVWHVDERDFMKHLEDLLDDGE